MEVICVAVLCVSIFGVLGSEPPLSPEAQEAMRQGGWDGCADMACIAEYDPVCGSDGKTYSNFCMLTVAQCTRTSIAMAHKGECPVADQARDVPQTEGCDDIPCQVVYRPVCGTDHKSYFSECALNKARCKSNPTLKVEYEGLCQRNHIPLHPHSEIPDHIPEDCRTFCTMEYQPVCGSDGHTYGNKCELESTACVQKSGLRMVKQGACETQEAPLRLKRTKKCDNRCPKMYKPVCGSDSKTYANECLLLVENCNSGGSLSVAHKGEC